MLTSATSHMNPLPAGAEIRTKGSGWRIVHSHRVFDGILYYMTSGPSGRQVETDSRAIVMWKDV